MQERINKRSPFVAGEVSYVIIICLFQAVKETDYVMTTILQFIDSENLRLDNITYTISR